MVGGAPVGRIASLLMRLGAGSLALSLGAAGCLVSFDDFPVANPAEDASSGGSSGDDGASGSGASAGDSGIDSSSSGGSAGSIPDASDSDGAAGTGGDAAAALVAIGRIGEPCEPPTSLACAGHAQKLVLYCDPASNRWGALQSCSGQQLCDTRLGRNQGSCQDPVSLCIGAEPGDSFCVDADAVQCGPDLLTITTTSCASACADGSCVGACTPDSTRCSGVIPQTCDSEGQWQDGAPCAYVCSNGSCAGECQPGEKDCIGNQPRECDQTGRWQSGELCANVCSRGECVLSCSDGEAQCNAEVPQTCVLGQWQDQEACAYLCRDGSCSGSCVPGTSRCSGLVPESCDATGTWQAGTPCAFVCSAGACSGACAPGANRCTGLVPETCDADGQWQAGAACTFVCSAGTCSGVCTPSSKQCSGAVPQTCDATGQWQSGTACPALCTAGTCTGACSPGTTQCNGSVPQTCDTTGQWSDGSACPYLCRSGRCEGVCVPGSRRCSGLQPQQCDANGQWQNAGTVCPYLCSAGSCTGVCAPSSKQCSGNTPQTCDANGQWQSGTTCSGSTPLCSAGLCVASAPCVAELAGGSRHNCVRRTDDSVWCWGANGYGQAGDGTTTTPRSSPVRVSGIGTGVTQLSLGEYFSCARKSDGTVWCWGRNDYSQLGDGTLVNRPSAVAATSVGIGVAQISAGTRHACAVKTSGTLWCWGDNGYGQVGDGTATSTPRQPVQVTALGSTVASVATGEWHTCAVKTDGTVWCWGRNNSGQLGNGTTSNSATLTPVQALGLTGMNAIVSSNRHTCARKSDGRLWCWGNNAYGQLGDSSTSSKSTPIEVTAIGAIASMALGYGHTCVTKADKSLWCWGWNAYGQVGNGTTTTPVLAPYQVSGAGAVVGLGAGDGHTCAHGSDGPGLCWGRNDYGQLGDGTTLGQDCVAYICQPVPKLTKLTCP